VILNRKLSRTSGVLFLACLAACGSSAGVPNTTTSDLDPVSFLRNNVKNFAQSYVSQAVIERPELLNTSTAETITACVIANSQNIALSVYNSQITQNGDNQDAERAVLLEQATNVARAQIEQTLKMCHENQ
jgi:hypothetical protein